VLTRVKQYLNKKRDKRTNIIEGPQEIEQGMLKVPPEGQRFISTNRV
jgi:hypothetical protein